VPAVLQFLDGGEALFGAKWTVLVRRAPEDGSMPNYKPAVYYIALWERQSCGERGLLD